MGRRRHWDSFYASSPGLQEPSPFARSVEARLGSRALRLLEIGCGDGRDATFFAAAGARVVAVDKSEEAVELCRRSHRGAGAEFICGEAPMLLPRSVGSFDVVYARFVLHAMTLAEEIATLAAAHALLAAEGRLFLEARSIKDPLARLGEVLSSTERLHGHYRRFIVKEELEERLKEAGFAICELIESDGLAPFGAEDPVVLRVFAQKRNQAG